MSSPGVPDDVRTDDTAVEAMARARWDHRYPHSLWDGGAELSPTDTEKAMCRDEVRYDLAALSESGWSVVQLERAAWKMDGAFGWPSMGELLTEPWTPVFRVVAGEPAQREEEK